MALFENALWKPDEEKKMYFIYQQETKVQPQDEFVMQHFDRRIKVANQALDFAQISNLSGAILNLVRRQLGIVYKRNAEL